MGAAEQVLEQHGFGGDRLVRLARRLAADELRRRVFQGLNVSSARQAMGRACLLAKIPHYSPHDLRHRRLTLWHQSGVPARELAERAGHSKPSMSLDVYTHVTPVAEVKSERLAAVLVDEGR